MLLTDDLLHIYKRCQRRAFLDLYGDRQEQEKEKDFVKKLHQESQKHLEQVLSRYQYVNIEGVKIDSYEQKYYPSQSEKIAETETLMAQGVEVIYQGILSSQNLAKFLTKTAIIEDILSYFPEGITFISSPSLLIKIAGKSKFGDWLYLPINIKFGSRPKGEYKLIGAFNAYLLAEIQGVLPPYASLILRSEKEYKIQIQNWLTPLQEIITNFLEMSAKKIEPEVFISRQRCSLCPWYNHCYQIAQAQKHLCLIPGITPKRYEQLQELKINNVESLAQASPENLSEYMGDQIAIQLQQQARSIITNQALLKPKSNYNNLIIPTNNIEIYFDIEAEPDLNLDYLLGVLLINRQEKSHRFYPLLAEKPEDEIKIWQEFIALLKQFPDAPIFHFSEYEIDTINRLASLYQIPTSQRQQILDRCVDLHYFVTNYITVPVENYSLKSLGNWLGFQWYHQGIGGDQCVWWYDQWLKTGDRELLKCILRYNEDDCWATFHLKNWLVQFLSDKIPTLI